MTMLHRALPPLVLAAAAAAQISVTATALTPITAACTEFGVTVTITRPIGPLAAWDFLDAHQTISGATLEIASGATGERASFGFTQQAVIDPGAPAGTSAATGPAELAVAFTCPTVTPVRLNVTLQNYTTPGAPQPTALLEVDGDGVVDYINGIGVTAVPRLAVGPQPLVVHVSMASALQQPGSVAASLLVEVVPDTDVHIQAQALGCGGTAALTATPTFVDHGVRIAAASFVPAMPYVFVVFGWGIQPQLLPSYGTAPCLFVPSIDLVVPLVWPQYVDIALPPAVRPVTFWIQGVTPLWQPLLTDALRIHAF